MGITYTSADWAFNSEYFAEVLSGLTPEDLEACRELMGVTKSAIRNWSKDKYTTEMNYPHMTNFLAVCNLLDLDPRDFFTLE